MKNTSFKIAAAAAAVASLFASAANAGGFQLTEQSALGLGRAYAGAGVDGSDVSGVYYNPASMTLTPGTAAQLGFVGVGLNLDYADNTGTSENGRKAPELVPHAYISHQVNDTTWVGFSFTVPFGMSTEYDRNWAHKDHGTDAEIMVFDFNPSVAWKVTDKVRLGAGISFQYVDASLGMGGTAPTDASFTKTTNVHGQLEATSTAWGWNAGILFMPVENVRLGLSYRSQIQHKAEGDLTIDGLSSFALSETQAIPLNAFNGTYDSGAVVSAPAWAMMSAAWDVNSWLSLYATFRWTDWSSFESLKVDTSALESAIQNQIGHSGLPPEQMGQIGAVVGQMVEGMSYIRNNWRDTYLYAVGGDVRVNSFWTLRGGIAYETSPIQERETRTAIIPDADRWWFAVGSTFNWTKDFQTDVAFAHLHGVHERSLYDKHTGEELGKFRKLDAFLLGVQAQYRF